LRPEVKARRFDTTERAFALFWRSVFLALSVVLILVTVYCYLHGSHKTIPFVTAPISLASGIASYLQWLRARAAQPPIDGQPPLGPE
jgi:hypothetical protein